MFSDTVRTFHDFNRFHRVMEKKKKKKKKKLAFFEEKKHS